MSALIAALPTADSIDVDTFTRSVEVFEPTAARCTCSTVPCCCCCNG